MKKRIFLSLFFMFIGLAIFAQTTNSDLSDALASIGMSKTWATIIVSLLGGVALLKIIPGKWTDPIAQILKVLKVIVVFLQWVNDKINNGNSVEKYAVKQVRMARDKPTLSKAIKKAWVTISIISFLLILPGILQAQSPWRGFWKPVPDALMKATGTEATSQFLFRPTVAISAAQFYIANKQIVSSTLSGAGIGVSYNHFTTSNETLYNDYGFNALALFGTTDAGNLKVSPVLTVSYLNFSAGGGYDISAKRAFVITSITLSFN
jgi:hypothetical protein